MPKSFSITQLIDKLQDYIQLKGEQLKLEVMGRTAKVLSYVIVYSIVAMLGLFLFFFAGLTLAVYLNYLLQSEFYGYLIVCGAVLLVLTILIALLKTGKITRWLEGIILKVESDDEA